MDYRECGAVNGVSSDNILAELQIKRGGHELSQSMKDTKWRIWW